MNTLTAINDPLEQEKAQMWELFAQLMDLDPDYKFTAKELSQELDQYSKSELNKLLFRLYLNKALKMHGKGTEATRYSINKAFLTGEPK